jgi:hypothetical protein
MIIGHKKKALYYQGIINICAILELQLSGIQILPAYFKIKYDTEGKKLMWKSAKL